MADVNDLYERFVREWFAGQAPDVATYLDGLAPTQADELAELLETFLLAAPTVEPQGRPAAASDPVLAGVLALGDAFEAPSWGARLEAARRSAGLSLRDLGERFAAAFGLDDRALRASSLLERLERGELPSSGVSVRAARALARIVGAPDGALIPPRAAALYRAESAEAAALEGLLAGASAALALEDGEVWDELDDLLRGG